MAHTKARVIQIVLAAATVGAAVAAWFTGGYGSGRSGARPAGGTGAGVTPPAAPTPGATPGTGFRPGGGAGTQATLATDPMASLGAAFTRFGDLAGLLTWSLLLVLVVTLIGVPWIERAWGRERLTAAHRAIGFCSIALLVIHVATLVLGQLFTQTALQNLAGRAGGRARVAGGTILDRPWLAGALTGALILVAVVVMSSQRVRASMSDRTWGLWHLYAYAGLIIAFAHQVANGSDLRGGWQLVCWWALTGTVAVLALVFRVVRPLLLRGRATDAAPAPRVSMRVWLVAGVSVAVLALLIGLQAVTAGAGGGQGPGGNPGRGQYGGPRGATPTPAPSAAFPAPTSSPR